MYCLNKNLLLRIEFFGGILINRNTFQRYELNRSETIFLKALEAVNNLDISEKIHNSISATKKYDIDHLLNIGVIVKIDSNENFISDIDLITQDIRDNINIISNYNFLSSPLEITIYPSLKCNLNCKFCFVKNKNCNEISSKKWLEIISEAKSMGTLSVSILGGEPSLYSEIDELLLGIESIGIKTTITSNGTSLKQSTKQILINSDFIVPVISLQSLNSKNKDLMGIDYTNPLQTIEFFLTNKKTVRINSVYTTQSPEDFYEIIDFVVAKGIDRYSISTYVESNDTNTVPLNKTLLDSRVLDENICSYIDENYNDKKVNYSLEGCLLYSSYPELMNEITSLSHFERLYYGCRAAQSKLEIYPNGDVYPCICFEDIVKPTSNIINSTLKNIWYDDFHFNKLRNERVTNDTCLLCGFSELCNGGCPALKHKLYGDDYTKFKDTSCLISNDIIRGLIKND